MYGRALANSSEDGGGLQQSATNRELAEWKRSAYDDGPSLLDIPSIFSAIVRHRWVFLGVVAACLLAAIAWVATQTPLYRAEATLELNPSTTRVIDLDKGQEEAVQPDRDFLALQIGLMESRSLAERVARKLNLARNAAFLGHEPSGVTKEATTAAADQLMDNFSATGTTSDRIVKITYVHPNPAVAAQVVNAYADEAVESTFERAYESTARSRAFLQRQLETTRQELERSERELIAYAREANIVNVVTEEGATSGDSAGGTLVASNLVALNQQLADAQNARIVAEQRYRQAGASANAAAVADSTVQALQQQRAQAQAEYDQKLERYLPNHPEMVALKARIAGLQQQIAQASGRAASSVSGSLRADYVAAQNRERELQGKIKQLEGNLLDLNDRGVKYTILRRAVEANRSLYNALLAKLGEENSSGTKSSSVALIDNAQAPSAPFAPNIPRTLILALLGGIVLGTGAAIGLDRWRDTINSPDDVRDALGLRAIGIIPRLEKGQQVDDELRDPRSPVAEAYHSARAALQFMSTTEETPKSILFTSSRAGEGKTTSVIALAADFISIGKRVVVIDADLRNPSIKGPAAEGGLTAVLSERRALADEVRPTETPDLFLLHAGTPPLDPTVLLASNALARVIERLEREFDVVIIDGPPVLGLADAPLIASSAQATLLVIEAGKTRRGSAANAVNRLILGGGALVGAILTKFDGTTHGYGYGDYGYGYTYDLKSEKRALIGPARREDEAV
jgi:capsular exopolysaccharide synthesis family protein